MPLAAEVERVAPPARAALLRAVAKLPTVRTVAGLSTRKSAGSAEAVLVVAGIPMPSKFCVTVVLVERAIAAHIAQAPMRITSEAERILHRRVPRYTNGRNVLGMSTLKMKCLEGSKKEPGGKRILESGTRFGNHSFANVTT